MEVKHKAGGQGPWGWGKAAATRTPGRWPGRPSESVFSQQDESTQLLCQPQSSIKITTGKNVCEETLQHLKALHDCKVKVEKSFQFGYFRALWWFCGCGLLSSSVVLDSG